MKITIRGRENFLAEAAGWSADRKVDVSGLVQDMETAGFDVSGLACRFLEMFWKIRIKHPPSIFVNGREIFCWTEFNPIYVCTERDSRIASRCARVVGDSLCPVGIDGFHMILYISPHERIFAGIDASVFRYAETVDEFFGKLVEGARPQHIGDWEI